MFSICNNDSPARKSTIDFERALRVLLRVLGDHIDSGKSKDFDHKVKTTALRLIDEEKLRRYFITRYGNVFVSPPKVEICETEFANLVESLEAFASNISSFDYIIRLDSIRCLFSDLGGLFGLASIALMIVFFIVLFVVAVGPNAHSLTTSPPFVLNFFSIVFCSSLGLSGILFGCSWMADGLIARESDKIVDNKYDNLIKNKGADNAKLSNRANIISALKQEISSQIDTEKSTNSSEKLLNFT